MKFKRSSGILLHPTSLPGKFGVGNIGEEAKKFIDFMVEAKQKIWQFLPLNYPGYGNSPYNPISAFANNPILIDLEKLVQKGLIEEMDLNNPPEFKKNKVEFQKVIRFKTKILKKAFHNFNTNKKSKEEKYYKEFCLQNKYWLDDFSLFAALREYHQGKLWNKWDEQIRLRKPDAIKKWKERLSAQIEYHKFIQYLFADQWQELKQYAIEKKIEFMGDIPIYVALDSADAWANQELFKLDKNGNPLVVAGVPPDYFSRTGQLWGNPIYNWDKMQKGNFLWWKQRIMNSLAYVDYIRIDHFIGLVRNWQVPYEEKTAENGKWINAPGEALLTSLKKNYGNLPIIAEDLGKVTDEVIALRKKFEFPGMEPLQFAFYGNHIPPNEFLRNKVVYTGTHDNDTTLGWFKFLRRNDKKIYNKVKKYLNTDEENICWDMIELAYSTSSIWAITTMQDIFCLDSEARMNTPATVEGNWEWRFSDKMLETNFAKRLATLAEKYER